jgi:RimJ/RimL family protein N-acetyltransferase
MRTIRSQRLVLEPQTASHAEEMFAVLNDHALYEYENAPPRSLEWLRERLGKLETRRSADGTEHWLNWVIRIPTSELIGYVQATVHPDGRAAIAYVLAGRFWGRGLAQAAVQAVVPALKEDYGVRRLSAVFKRRNHRSQRLLERLGFSLATPDLHAALHAEPDEMLMVKDPL